MKIILIGNYLKDGQESMERFALMLNSGFEAVGLDTEIWRPKVIFGKCASSTVTGFGKWLGYVDKWIIFPLILRIRLYNHLNHNREIRFHICDHSNSPYLNQLPINRTVITCHDVIAVRAGLGYENTYVPASRFGKLFQKWILSSLTKARFLATVSQLTMNQLMDLVPDQHKFNKKKWKVVYNAFNAEFIKLDTAEAKELMKVAGIDPHKPFILHVGSCMLRKNRRMLVDMVAALGNKWNGNICFAGLPLHEAVISHIKSLGLESRVFFVQKPDHDTLKALYSACEAFIFPSFSEGFGWPVIEAQACGAPVIASAIEPLPEVSGGAALHADPHNPFDFAAALLALQDNSTRYEIIARGFENCTRFGRAQMIDKYLELHGLVQEKV